MGIGSRSPPMDTNILRCSSPLYKMRIHRFDIHRTEDQQFIVLWILTNIQSSLHCVIIVHCDYSVVEYFLYLYRQETRIFLHPPPPECPFVVTPLHQFFTLSDHWSVFWPCGFTLCRKSCCLLYIVSRLFKRLDFVLKWKWKKVALAYILNRQMV